MLRFGKHVGVELLWFVGLCAVGAYIWVMIAGSYEAASDAYWMAHGHPPASGMYRAPWEWRFVITLTPYLLSVVTRMLQTRTRRLRSSVA